MSRKKIYTYIGVGIAIVGLIIGTLVTNGVLTQQEGEKAQNVVDTAATAAALIETVEPEASATPGVTQ